MSEITQVTGAAQATTDAAPASSAAPAATTESQSAAPAVSGVTPQTAQQSETQAPAATAATGETAEAKTENAPAVKVIPEQYAEFKLPEGVVADVELSTEFKTVAKELGLSQDEAQRVNDIGAKMLQKMTQQQTERRQAVVAEWDTATKTDKEFGGDKLKSSLLTAEKALNEFGTPELFKLLDDSGLRKHPEIIRMFFKAGKAISNDRIVPAGYATGKQGVDAAKVLYPNS